MLRPRTFHSFIRRESLFFLFLENILCLNADFSAKYCDEPKKFFFQKLEEEIDFILRMPETVGFACALSKILERSKSITLVLNIVPGSKSKILVLSA